MTDNELIQVAIGVLNPHRTSDGRLFGDVGAAIFSYQGNVYAGVCVDTASWGLCAERSAMAAMITAREFKIRKMVAVWQGSDRKLYLLPPCGVCREFMARIDDSNLQAEVLMGRNKSIRLNELLPYHEWPEPLDA